MKAQISDLKFQIRAFCYCICVAIFATVSFAGARIDLRPTPPPNGADYQVGDIINVEAFLVDTGNPQGALGIRGIFLDFEDSSGLTYPGIDAIPGTDDDDQFHWYDPTGLAAVFPYLPRPSIGYPMVFPPFPPPLPPGGEMFMGDVNIRLESIPATLDVMNDDVSDPNYGARIDFGFGGPGDPVTTWRAFTGDLTGGVLIIPEPATFGLVAGIVAFGTLFKRNVPRRGRSQH